MEPTAPKENSSVDAPPHYNQGKIECIEFIEDQNFDYHLGNAIKYIVRARHKGKYMEDLAKAVWYLQRAMIKDLSPHTKSMLR